MSNENMQINKIKKFLIAPYFYDLGETNRMFSIANELLRLGYEVIVLGKGIYDYIFSDKSFKKEYIDYDEVIISSEFFYKIHNIDKFNLNFYTFEELDNIVRKEVELLKRLKPAAVITGFRPSMSISTKISKIPLIWTISACISDMYYKDKLATIAFYHMKKIFTLRLLPKFYSTIIYRFVTLHFPISLKIWNKVLKKNKIKKFTNVLEILRGDYNLMTDPAELFPEFKNIPPYYGFCGPIFVESNIETPLKLKNFKKTKGKPVIFLSMGSSGEPELFKKIISYLKGTNFDVFVATTSILNKDELNDLPDNFIVEKMFPPYEVTAVSDIAIIHGGQGTLYTTIIAGTPFIGIPIFIEQQYNLEHMARKGCGITLSRYKLNKKILLDSINSIMQEKSYRENVSKIREQIIKYKNNKDFLSPKIASLKILNFLNNSVQSYFDEL